MHRSLRILIKSTLMKQMMFNQMIYILTEKKALRSMRRSSRRRRLRLNCRVSIVERKATMARWKWLLIVVVIT